MRWQSSILYGVIALGIFSVLGGPQNLALFWLNITDSLPRGIYKVTDLPLERGMIVAECLPGDLAAFAKERDYVQEGGCPENVMPILKEIVGVAGDEIELTDSYVAVNGRVIFNSETREKDSKGRWMPKYPRGKFLLQEGEVFLLATNSERSWDGRYMGPSKIAYLTATLRPMWTEEKQ